MSQEQIEVTEVRGYPVEKIEEILMNPNVMSLEEEKTLEEDMRTNGPECIDPVEVVSKGLSFGERKSNFPSLNQEFEFVCINGNHRLRLAKKLKWRDIRIIVNKQIKSERDLALFNYRKNAERGHVDPMLEAQLF